MPLVKIQVLLPQQGEAYQDDIFNCLHSGICTKIEE